MAGRDRSLDVGRDTRRTDNVCPHRAPQGFEPERRKDVYRSEGAQLGAPEAEAGLVMDIYDGEPWTEMDIEDLKEEIEHGCSIQEAAEFLCRADSIEDVERKARELGLIK